MDKNYYEITQAVLTPNLVQPLSKGAGTKVDPIEFNLTEYTDNAANHQPTVWEDVCYRADEFRLWLATRCCACLSSVPSLALVIVAAILIMLLIATIPLAFALTYINPRVSTADDLQGLNNTKIEHPTFRSHKQWPEESGLFIYKDWEDHITLRTTSLLPKNISICTIYGFACTGQPHKVISKNRRCDGYFECEDGSDELDCHECQTTLSCPASENGHSNRKICLVGTNLCDGHKDCPNGEDETVYCRNTCTEGEHKCRDADICIPREAVCDGEEHCPFGDDETNCTGECKNGAKTCQGKLCLPKRRLCDGIIDCIDKSDEMDCDCTSCSGKNSVLCNGPEKLCISKDQVCDERKDCPGGEDEDGCPGVCLADTDKYDDATKVQQVRCANGQFYDWHEACDGTKDHCRLSCAKCNPEMAFKCESTITQSINGQNLTIGTNLMDNAAEDSAKSPAKMEIQRTFKECIHRSLVCDGKPDCSDGSDEVNCCGQNTIECRQHGSYGLVPRRCFSDSQKCDGYSDCIGAEDEFNCTSCANGAFLCQSEKRCIPSSSRCDGVEDCLDISDEENCTCQECSRQPTQMYMCSGANRCFPLRSVCSPYSLCPNATKLDQLFCAVRGKEYF